MPALAETAFTRGPAYRQGLHEGQAKLDPMPTWKTPPTNGTEQHGNTAAKMSLRGITPQGSPVTSVITVPGTK